MKGRRKWTIWLYLGFIGLASLFALYSWSIECSLVSEIFGAKVEYRMVFVDKETGLRIPSVKYEVELNDGTVWKGIASDTGSASLFRDSESVESFRGRRRFLGIAYAVRQQIVPFTPWQTFTARTRQDFVRDSIASKNFGYEYLGYDETSGRRVFEYTIPMSRS